MVEQPLDPAVTLADFDQLNAALITCGAPMTKSTQSANIFPRRKADDSPQPRRFR